MPPPTPHAIFSPTFPSLLPTLSPSKKLHFFPPNQNPLLRIPSPSSSSSFSPTLPKCSLLSISTEASPKVPESRSRPSPAEVSRTIMELSSAGTLSTPTDDGWPLGIGAQFVVDAEGSPALCLSQSGGLSSVDGRSSFHVQFEQSRSRTPQCTLVGTLKKPGDELFLKKLCAKWEKKFGEQVDENLVYVISVERVLQMDDFKEDGKWVTSSEYLSANPDPLRNFAEKIVDEMNSRHAEDVRRLCNIYVDSGFQVTATKMIWVDRLGFDLYLYSENGVFTARVPFPREVTDEKGVKSSFNSMSHLAWEVEKNYVTPEFEMVKSLKRVR